jgi:repressor LexA
MVGTVVAGFPTPAEEELRDIISFDDYLITKAGESFLLKVTGDSMSGAGIMEGDLVIVEKGRMPKNGDIVLAEADGEWTIKYFTRRGKNIVLEAANPQYPAISPRMELKLAGVVTAVVRKYHL